MCVPCAPLAAEVVASHLLRVSIWAAMWVMMKARWRQIGGCWPVHCRAALRFPGCHRCMEPLSLKQHRADRCRSPVWRSLFGCHMGVRVFIDFDRCRFIDSFRPMRGWFMRCWLLRFLFNKRLWVFTAYFVISSFVVSSSQTLHSPRESGGARTFVAG